MPRKYKILLSAYACEPNKGSEPGVGWNWALEIAKRGHEVWVLTRSNNMPAIQNYFTEQQQCNNLHFIYYDLPKWLSFWKKKGRGVHLYYFLWQIGILKLAKKKHKEINFDIVHHITFVTIHQPSFLFLLKNTKFFYGPAAGGDIIPFRFLKSFPVKERIKEFLHFCQNKMLKYDPFRCLMFSKTDLIFCNSKQTQSFIPQNYRYKTYLNLAIGINVYVNHLNIKQSEHLISLLYVGRFLQWKGLNLSMSAINKVSNRIPCHLTLIGKGNLKSFQNQTGFSKQLKIISWMPQNKLLEAYKNYDILLFPSFRDSGGMVVLEAMSQGLPVICLDLGGPGQIVNETCGKVITTNDKTEEELIQSIAEAIIELYNNPQLLKTLSEGAIKRAKEFSWDKTVSRVYERIEGFMAKSVTS